MYLIALYRWPVQVSSDEAAIMDTAKQYATLHVPDPLGVSFYLTRPALLFIAWGKLGNALGGVDLFHMRLLHALVGLLAVAATYALFRQLMPRGWAFLASLLVGFSHAMFMISRLAMRENTAVLLLVVALALLLWGLRENHELATFLGGVVAGLGFYVYYPARVAFPIWVVFLIATGLVYRKKFAPRRLALLGAVAAAGVLLTALPISYSESQVPAADRSGQNDTLLIFNAAREQQKDWVFAHSQLSGYLTNVKYGLGTFNSSVVDHGWIYLNPGHGFVDPLTGILLWLGVGVVAVGLIRRRREDEGALLMLIGFLVLWLSFAFAVNKAPNYTRLLVTLPFVAFFVVESLRWLVRPVAVDPIRRAGRSWARSSRHSSSGTSRSAGTSSSRAGASAIRSGAPAATRTHTRTSPGRSTSSPRATRRPTTNGAISARRSSGSRSSRPGSVLRRSTRSSSCSSPPRLRSRSSCAGRSGRPSRPSSPSAIRAGGSATSRPTACGSCSKFRRRRLARHAPAPDRHCVRSSPFAHCSQAVRFPASSLCWVPRIVPMPQKQ